MTSLVKRLVGRGLGQLGYTVSRTRSPWPRDFEQPEIDLCREVAPYTMTTPEAILTLADAVRHIVAQKVPGAIVECGVWRGGSMMAVARTLLDIGETNVDLYLFDTFAGMSEPGEKDVHWSGETARAQLAVEPNVPESLLWARAGLAEVQAAMRSTDYPASRVHFVEGMVEETLPARAPEHISLLRLDTDWYEPTLHELIHLYPRLEPGGILILDDYGWWRGARDATDEYFSEHEPRPFLVRIDADGVRLAVKPR
jgi:O-methyltransferase